MGNSNEMKPNREKAIAAIKELMKPSLDPAYDSTGVSLAQLETYDKVVLPLVHPSDLPLDTSQVADPPTCLRPWDEGKSRCKC
ncbi:hypothetical protein CMUS01_02672 [Colletotrichum musicola]|uniref:Uncharacterized protein n=1 Tax=Colletotrichum musicola TaxID=2175873 RepID=A0A8H6NUT8_9PEZI|nr:hypothetical protein CMUS01_02672 [Colletotrichum musicola]